MQEADRLGHWCLRAFLSLVVMAGVFIAPLRADVDGDGKSDFVVWRASQADWYILPSGGGSQYDTQWGISSDTPLTGDYDGDGKSDLALWRASTAEWYILLSGGGWMNGVQFGVTGDIPVVGDFDGDGKSDLAVWRPSNATWYILPSGSGSIYSVQWGISSDKPVVGDFDGDGKSDFAVWRASEANWYILPSGGGSSYKTQWGISSDTPLIGDYDGDGKSDLALWRSSDAEWYILLSAGGWMNGIQFGVSGDIPVVGDFDGDGKSDLAVWRPSNATWYILPSGGSSIYSVQWGISSDLPLSDPVKKVRIAGQVTAGSSGLPGASVTLTGTTAAGFSISLSTITDSNGNYFFTVPSGGSYTVVSFKSGYSINPPSSVFNNPTATQTVTATASVQTGTLSQSCSDISGTWTDGNYTYAISEPSGIGLVTGTDTLILPYGSVTWNLSGQTTDGMNYQMKVYNPTPTSTDFGIPDQEDDFTLSNITCSLATLTLTNRITGSGSSLLGSGNASTINQTTTWTRKSTPTSVPKTADVTVIAWVDATKITLPTPQTPDLSVALNSPLRCSILLAQWSFGKTAGELNGQADANYANAWLLMHSNNAQPPSFINPASELTAGDFRLFNRFQIVSNGNLANPTAIPNGPPIVGATPDPCGSGKKLAGQIHPSNGNIGIDTTGKGVAQLAEGRLGSTGQAINATINGRTTPWIWSVIEFDSTGNIVVPVDHAMFPSYSIYVNGNLAQTCPQSDPASFIANDQSYQRSPSQIPVSPSLIPACHN